MVSFLCLSYLGICRVCYGPTYLVLLGVLDVDVAVEFHGCRIGRIDDIADGLLLAYNAVMVATIAGQKD